MLRKIVHQVGSIYKKVLKIFSSTNRSKEDIYNCYKWESVPKVLRGLSRNSLFGKLLEPYSLTSTVPRETLTIFREFEMFAGGGGMGGCQSTLLAYEFRRFRSLPTRKKHDSLFPNYDIM
jgi:hypothetical protein